ncbi:hypothetical protein AB5I41_22495 [Sphingomonas sp. MMS24-JH45]
MLGEPGAETVAAVIRGAHISHRERVGELFARGRARRGNRRREPARGRTVRARPSTRSTFTSSSDGGAPRAD